MKPFAILLLATFLGLTNVSAGEPRPPGVSWRIQFSVTPLYPRSFEIAAVGPRSFPAEKLKDAWQKKALMVANSHRFKTSPFVVHDNETDYGTYWPYQTRGVSATITLLD